MNQFSKSTLRKAVLAVARELQGRDTAEDPEVALCEAEEALAEVLSQQAVTRQQAA